MLAKVSITVDCLGRPAVCEVAATIRTGEDELDRVLFQQMAIAVRHLADEVDVDQAKRILEEPNEGVPRDAPSQAS